MKELLGTATEFTVFIIDGMALVIIAIGTIEAFVKAILMIIRGTRSINEFRDVYVHYARYLVAALTFQLAADILETAIAPTWTDIGYLGAIAVIRTFLNFFLERDLSEMREVSAADKKPALSEQTR
jgi:uncharacterized membrane protein